MWPTELPAQFAGHFVHVKWEKKGLIYSVDRQSDWAYSHTHKPTPFLLDKNTLRIYFGVRGVDGRTRTTFIDVDAYKPHIIRNVSPVPVLDLGPIGAFDDAGANVCSVLKCGDDVFMYYIGWNPSTTVHTRNSIGLAVSRDGGSTFERAFIGPVLDRNKDEPYYTGAVDVMRDDDVFRMWYTSGTEWVVIDGKPEIKYHIKYATSTNGIDWHRDGISCIPPAHAGEATARPSVMRVGNKYMMWFSARCINGFRSHPNSMYRAGFATSTDGIVWNRDDRLAGINPSPSGWDCNSIAYPYAIRSGGKLMLFYNGNGFGRSGFGYAVGELM